MTSQRIVKRYTTQWYDFSLEILFNSRECTFSADVFDEEFKTALFYDEGFATEAEAVEAACKAMVEVLCGGIYD